MVRDIAVKRDTSHIVLLRETNEHLGSDSNLREVFVAPRLLSAIVHLAEDLLQRPFNNVFGLLHALGEGYDDAPPMRVHERLFHNEVWVR